ncbi:MAG: YgiT-type zinc finger protein [Pelotomaculum sp.]|nr:YgiT-type zinc finger protein [Pelotomaculum sp.]
MKQPLEPVSVCAECYSGNAQLRFREERAEKNGALLLLEKVPYYLCPVCGEETYDLDVEVFVEKEIEKFLEGEEKSRTVNVWEAMEA